MTEEEEGTATVEDIDERRLNRRAYDYLCRVLEVRTWLVECLREEEESVAAVTQLEENLRNGVLLARLGHSFAPDVVHANKIYDADQSRYGEEKTLRYRHTDNIMLWRRSMESVRLPEIFIPETVDVYEGRNAKTIFCLYALAFHLYRLRKAPPIRNQAGNAVFSSSDMEEMKEHLKDSKLPEFSAVGGMLSEKMSSLGGGEDALEAIAIAIRNQDSAALLVALQSAEAGMLSVEARLADEYLKALSEVVEREHLEWTRDTVQGAILRVNVEWGCSRLDFLLSSDAAIDSESLLEVLDVMQIENARTGALSLYIRLLSARRQELGRPLTADEVCQVIDEANAVVEVKVAAGHGSCLDSLAALSLPALSLSTVSENARLYHHRLQSVYSNESADFFLLRPELASLVNEFSQVDGHQRQLLELSSAAGRSDEEAVSAILKQIVPDEFVEGNVAFYIARLQTLPQEELDDRRLRQILVQLNEEVAAQLKIADQLIDLSAAGRGKKTAEVTRILCLLLREMEAEKGEERKKKEEARPEMLPWYTQRVIKDTVGRANGDINGHSHREWFRHDFVLGAIYVETEERKWSSRQQNPITENVISLQQLQEMMSEERAAFHLYYAEHIKSVRRSQQLTRKYLRKKRDLELKKELERQDEAARRIQNTYNKFKFRKDTLALKSEEAPSLRLVRKFVTYLQDKDYDISEELELEKAKSRVTTLVSANQEMDRNLLELDEKIALLIKNKINVQEVIAHKKKMSDEEAAVSRTHSLRRKDKQLTESLEQLLYHLQVDSPLLANFLEAENSAMIADAASSFLSPIFGFLTETREEFLLVRLLCEFLERDIGEAERIDALLAGRRLPIIGEILVHPIFNSINFLITDLLKEELRLFFATEKKDHATFNLDPVDIYSSMYKAAGKKDVDVQSAVDDANVKEVLEESKTFLAEWSEMFVKKILAEHELPRSVRYLAVHASDCLRRRFPAASAAEIEKVVAELVHEIWLTPNLLSSRQLAASTGREATEDALHKITAITKFIRFAVSNRGYGNSKWYLTSLNKQIHLIFESFRAYVHAALSSVRVCADLYGGLNEYTHYNPASHPVLSLHTKQANHIIRTTNAHANIMLSSPSAATSLSTGIRNLLSSISPESLQDERTHILHLRPIPTAYSNGAVEEERQLQQVFARAKKHVVELLLAGCIGSSLPELLQLPASSGVENTHRRLFNSDPPFANVAAKQEEISRLLSTLETAGRVSASDDFQSLVTDIANDIRLATERRRQRVGQRRNLEESEARLQKQREELNQKLAKYELYLNACLESQAKSITLRRSSKDSVKSGRRLSLLENRKTSVEKLFKKGVLVDNLIAGSDNTRRAAKWIVELTDSNRKGVFDVRVLDGKDVLGEYSFDFQDLLAAQSHGDKKFSLKNSLIFSVNDLVSYINRKFYGK